MKLASAAAEGSCAQQGCCTCVDAVCIEQRLFSGEPGSVGKPTDPAGVWVPLNQTWQAHIYFVNESGGEGKATMEWWETFSITPPPGVVDTRPYVPLGYEFARFRFGTPNPAHLINVDAKQWAWDFLGAQDSMCISKFRNTTWKNIVDHVSTPVPPPRNGRSRAWLMIDLRFENPSQCNCRKDRVRTIINVNAERVGTDAPTGDLAVTHYTDWGNEIRMASGDRSSTRAAVLSKSKATLCDAM